MSAARARGCGAAIAAPVGRPRAQGDCMTERMRALVKARPEPGLWMEEVPVPGAGAERCADPNREERDLQHGRAYLELGRLGAHGASADGGGSRILQPHRRDRQRGRSSGPASGCRARGISSAAFAANCRAGRGISAATRSGSGVRPGSFADYVCIPERNVVPIPTTSPTRSQRSSIPFGNAVRAPL